MQLKSMIAVVASTACIASAGVSTTNYADGDQGFLDLTNSGALEQAVVESRIGNGAGNGAWEVGLWRFGAVGTPLSQDDRGIDNGENASFSMSYDGGTSLSFSIDGITVASSEIGGSFTDIFIRMRGTSTSSVSFDSLQLDGSDLDITSVSQGDGVGYLRISNMGDSFGAFTLTGNQQFDWTGSRPNNSALAAQFKLTNIIPAPGSSAILALGVLGASRRRR